MEASSSTVLSNAILGVCFEDCGITDTANSILQDMREKADKLVTKLNFLVVQSLAVVDSSVI
jgi:hypothetical protein